MKFGKRLHRASLSFTDPAYAAHLLDYKALKKIIKRLASQPHFHKQPAVPSLANTSPALSSTGSSPAVQQRYLAHGGSSVQQLGEELSRELFALSAAGRAQSASAVRETAEAGSTLDAPSSNSSSASTASNSSLSIRIPSPQLLHCSLTSVDSPNSPMSTPSASPSPTSARRLTSATPRAYLTELEYHAIAREFIAALEAEMSKINTFYTRVVSSMADDVRLLRTVSEREGDLSSMSDLCETLNQLRKFIVLNYLGVIKIVKKHDKNAPHPVADRMIPHLYAQPFYHSLQVAALYTEIDSLSRRGLKAVSRDDYTCPLCSDLLECPVVLSCSHRFCWKCLSRAASSTSEHEACPVCRKPQLLDPSNYLVDDLLLKFIRANFPKKSNVGDARKLSSTTAPSAVDARNGSANGGGHTRAVGVKRVVEQRADSNGRHSVDSSYSQPSPAASYSSTSGASVSTSFASSSASSSVAIPAISPDWSDGAALPGKRRRSDAASPHDYMSGPPGPHLHSASSYRYHPYNDYSAAAVAHPAYTTPALPVSAHYAPAPAYIHPSQRQAQQEAEKRYQREMEEHIALQQQQQQAQQQQAQQQQQEQRQHDHEQQLHQNLQLHLQQQLQQQSQQQQQQQQHEQQEQLPPPPPHSSHHDSLLGSPMLPAHALELSPLLTSVSPHFAPTPPPGHSDLLELPSSAHSASHHHRLPIRPWQSQEGTGDKFLLPWLPEDDEDEDVCAEPTVDPVNIGYHWPHFHDYAADVEQLDRQVSHDQDGHLNGHSHHHADSGPPLQSDFDMAESELSEHVAAHTSPMSANSAASSLSSHDSFSSANMPLLSLTSMNHLLMSEDDVDDSMDSQPPRDHSHSPLLPPIESDLPDNPNQLLGHQPQLASDAYAVTRQQLVIEPPPSPPATSPPSRPSAVDTASIDDHMDSLHANLAAAMSCQQQQLMMAQPQASAAPALPYAHAIVVAEPQPTSAHSASLRSHPRSNSFHSDSSSVSSSSHSVPAPPSHLSQSIQHAAHSDFSSQPPPSGDYHYLPTTVVAMEVLPYPSHPTRPERRDSRGSLAPAASVPSSPLHSATPPTATIQPFVVPRFKHPSAISTHSQSTAPYISASAPSSPLTAHSDYTGRVPLSVNPSASPVTRTQMTSPSCDSVASSMSSPAQRPLYSGRVTPITSFPQTNAVAPPLPRASSYTAAASAVHFQHADESHDAGGDGSAPHYGLSVQIPQSSTPSPPQPPKLPRLPQYTPTQSGAAGVMSSSAWMPVVGQSQRAAQSAQAGSNGSAEEKEGSPDGEAPYSNLSPLSTASSGAGSMSALLLNSSPDALSIASSPTASSPQSGSSYLALAQEVGGASQREAALLRFNSTRNAPKFVCDHPGCADGFNTRFSLKRHLKTHSGEKPFQCDKCPKTFAEKSTLVRHLRIHTGEKPFRCSWDGCTRSFSDRTNVKRHEAQHEAQNDLPMEEQTAWMSEEAEREVLKKREAEARRRQQLLGMGVKLEDVMQLEDDDRRAESEGGEAGSAPSTERVIEQRERRMMEQADAQSSDSAVSELPGSDSAGRYVKHEQEEVKMDQADV